MKHPPASSCVVLLLASSIVSCMPYRAPKSAPPPAKPRKWGVPCKPAFSKIALAAAQKEAKGCLESKGRFSFFDEDRTACVCQIAICDTFLNVHMDHTGKILRLEMLDRLRERRAADILKRKRRAELEEAQAAQEKRRRAEQQQRRKTTFRRAYDRFTTRTLYMIGPPADLLDDVPYLQVIVTKKGRRVSTAVLGIFLSASEWRFLRCHTMYFLVDGKQWHHRGKYEGKTISGGTREFVYRPVSIRRLKQLARAKSVEYRICREQGKLSKHDQSLLAKMVADIEGRATRRGKR